MFGVNTRGQTNNRKGTLKGEDVEKRKCVFDREAPMKRRKAECLPLLEILDKLGIPLIRKNKKYKKIKTKTEVDSLGLGFFQHVSQLSDAFGDFNHFLFVHLVLLSRLSQVGLDRGLIQDFEPHHFWEKNCDFEIYLRIFLIESIKIKPWLPRAASRGRHWKHGSQKDHCSSEWRSLPAW